MNYEEYEMQCKQQQEKNNSYLGIFERDLMESGLTHKPYRNFKDEINCLGISESYYAWRLIALCKKAKNWCEENEVPYEIRTEGLHILWLKN